MFRVCPKREYEGRMRTMDGRCKDNKGVLTFSKVLVNNCFLNFVLNNILYGYNISKALVKHIMCQLGLWQGEGY